MRNYCEKCKYEFHDDDDYGCVLFGIECMKCKSFNEDEMGCNVHQKKIQFLAHRIKKRFDRTFRNDYSTPTNGKFSGRKFYKLPTGRTLRNESEYPYKPRMKGGHTHNHVKNAHKRMRRCRICDNPITKYEGFKAPWYGHICLDCYFEECKEEASMCGIPFGWEKSDNFYRSFIRRARKK